MKNKTLQYIIIVIVIGLIVGIPWLINSPEAVSNELLFTSNFEMPEPSVSRGDAGESAWESANYFYAREEFEKAMEQFQLALNDTSFKRKSEAYLYIGSIYFKQGEYDASLKAYNNIGENSVEFYRGLYQKAFPLVMNQEDEKAKKYLAIVIEDGPPDYAKKADELLKSMQ